ncbi:MAG: hypothetical protein COS17_07520, partial [Elusimicrobia bacterium CG02_land_8_20_14_3_00_37_13]
MAVGDLDNDGNQDILAGNYSSIRPTKIFKNLGNFNFTGKSIGLVALTLSVAVGDIDNDNDGDLDFVIGNYNQNNKIYRNDSGLNFFNQWSSPETDPTLEVGWGDYDNDGDLDLLVGNRNAPNRIYKNYGKGAFGLIWTSTNTHPTNSISWADYDNDGDLDFVAGNQNEPNVLYKSLDAEFDNINSSPSAPTDFNTNYSGGTLQLTWWGASDPTSPALGLYYNVKAGTNTNATNVISGKYGSPLFGNYLRPKVPPSLNGLNLNN